VKRECMKQKLTQNSNVEKGCRMNFSEQIKHPKWQEKRLRILERDDFKCQGCTEEKRNENDQLHVHHLRYFKDSLYWDYDDDLLITYCNNCHNHWQSLNKGIKAFLYGPLMEQCEVFMLIDSFFRLEPKKRRA